MRNESSLQLSPSSDKQESLESVLDQNVHIQNLVQESAEELSSVNAGIKEEIANQVCPSGFEHALEKSEVVEGKVQDASDKLAVVNLAIKGEIEEREVLDRKLAAVTEQGEVDWRAAMHDSLTDLPNRALFYDRLEHGFQQAKRHGWSLAVMFIDLNDFKVINDTYGHEAGDRVLQVIAGRLVEGTRGEDTVSRY
jgi:diguanylate cyclase